MGWPGALPADARDGQRESAGLCSSEQLPSGQPSEDNRSGKAPAETSRVCSWQRALCEFISSEGCGICEARCVSTNKEF